MAERTVVARLVLDIAGYAPAAVEASKSTSALTTAQKETAAAAKAAGAAQREAAAAAKDASATASASAQAMKAAQKEATAAAKQAAAAEVDASKATTDAERIQAEAVAQAAAERSAAAKEALNDATAQASADAEAATAAKAGAVEAAKYAAAQREVALAAKEAATAETTAAKESAAATAERTKAYSKSSTAMNTMALASGAAVGLMVKSAGDFQSATQHFVTDAGESQQNLAMVQAGILKTATDTGTSTTALTDAMYHIESAGFHGASGLNMLTVAAEGAKVGGADLGTVAKTLTGTMNSYNMSGDKSVTMMNELIATVGAGDMKMNDLASSLGNVTPKAAAAGISFAEVGGAIATMTAQNMSADQATQDLSNTISALQKPNSVQIAQMQQLGIDSTDVSQNLGQRGLTGTLQMLTQAVADHTQNGQVFIDSLKNSQAAATDANSMLQLLPPSIQNISKELLNGNITAAQYKNSISSLDAPSQHQAAQFEALVKSSGAFNTLLSSGKPEAETFSAALGNLLGGTTGLNTALMLTGGRMATFQANVATVQQAANKGGTEVDNWSKIQGTFNQKVDVAKASLGALGIAIGTTLLPVVADIAKAVTSVVTPIAEWVNQNQGLTAAVLGSATALAALVVAINLAIKGGQLVKTAYDGVKTAVDFFTGSAKVAAVETEALGAAQATAAVKTEALSAANAAGAASTEAMGAASAAAAEEVGAAGLMGVVGGAIPVVGAAAVGIGLLAGAFDSTSGHAAAAAASVDQFTTAMVNSKNDTANASMAFGHAADDLNVLNEALAGKLAVNAKFEGTSVTDLKRSFDYLAESSVASVEPMAQLGVELGKVNQVSGEASNSLKSYDGGLANLVQNGQIDRAKQLMAEIAQVTDNHGKALINTARDFPQYFAALDKLQSEQVLGISTTQSAAAAAAGNTGALNDSTKAALAQADATATGTGATAASTTQVSAQAEAQMQATAAARALAEAQAADADAANASSAAAKAHAAAKVNDTTATNDATAAAKAHESATKADTTTQKDAAKASADQSKADADAANASAAAANAAKVNADANATAAEKKKANSAASSAASKATNAQAAADNAASRASDAASSAADKHSAANNKSAKAASAAADAASKQAAANAKAASQTAAEAEAARQAAEVHKLGTTWLLAVANAEADAANSADTLDTSVQDEVVAMKDAKDKANNLKDALDALNGVHIAASKAAVDEQQKVADLTKALADNGKTLDITTDAGRKNITAIDDLAAAANAHAQAVAEESGSIDAGNKALDASRAEFDAVLKSAGYSTDQIDTFNKTLLATPRLANVTLQVTADTTAAAAALQKLENQYGGTGIAFGGGPGGKHIVPGYSTGGLVAGSGSGTSDSNMVALSNREYVVNAAAVARPGVLDALNKLNFGSGTASIVKPSIPMYSLPAGAASASSAGAGAALNIENYFENGAPPAAVASELAWLAKARGGQW